MSLNQEKSMHGELVSDQEKKNTDPPRPDELGDRLDPIIGETSSGIGAMLSELIRRSLKSGVSDIGKSLAQFAEESVEDAVERQLPAIAESADCVAESTSKRIVKAFADDYDEKSKQQKQEMEAKIQAVESSAIDHSRNHVDQVVSEVRQTVNESQKNATEYQAASDQKIEELQQKGRHSWKKVKEQLEALQIVDRQFHKQLDHFGQASQQLHDENASLREQLSQVQKRLEEQLDENSRFRTQHEALEDRLTKLEQPKGLRALFAKMGRGSKKQTADPSSDPSSDLDANSPGVDGES